MHVVQDFHATCVATLAYFCKKINKKAVLLQRRPRDARYIR